MVKVAQLWWAKTRTNDGKIHIPGFWFLNWFGGLKVENGKMRVKGPKEMMKWWRTLAIVRPCRCAAGNKWEAFTPSSSLSTSQYFNCFRKCTFIYPCPRLLQYSLLHDEEGLQLNGCPWLKTHPYPSGGGSGESESKVSKANLKVQFYKSAMARGRWNAFFLQWNNCW